VGDACADGACQAGPQVSCNDNNACTVDSCSATKGCGHVNAADQTSCGTGLWCIAASCKKKPLCGDNVLDTGEQCDDGNLDSGDGCSAGCLVEKPPVPLPGELLVTEIMVGPNVDDKYEWFELYNVTDKPLMLGGLWYGDGNLGKQFAANKVLNPKSYILLAATASPGGPTPDVVYGYDTGGIALNNSDDWVLICKTGSCANASDVVAGVHYTSGKNGWKTQTKGRSYQLSPSAYDGTKMTDGLNWCLGKSPYGTNADLGTPGKANDTCP
jgi:cysteine-rich repeat protein